MGRAGPCFLDERHRGAAHPGHHSAGARERDQLQGRLTLQRLRPRGAWRPRVWRRQGAAGRGTPQFFVTRSGASAAPRRICWPTRSISADSRARTLTGRVRRASGSRTARDGASTRPAARPRCRTPRDRPLSGAGCGKHRTARAGGDNFVRIRSEPQIRRLGYATTPPTASARGIPCVSQNWARRRWEMLGYARQLMAPPVRRCLGRANPTYMIYMIAGLHDHL